MDDDHRDTDGSRVSGNRRTFLHLGPSALRRLILLWLVFLVLLVVLAIFVNLLAVNNLFGRNFVPGEQLCHFAEQVHERDYRIPIPNACYKVRIR
jgi:hypothetical protein